MWRWGSFRSSLIKKNKKKEKEKEKEEKEKNSSFDIKVVLTPNSAFHYSSTMVHVHNIQKKTQMCARSCTYKLKKFCNSKVS